MRVVILFLIIAAPSLVTAQQWSTVSSSHAKFAFTGNVGIGTTGTVIPSEKLHVVGNARADQFNAVNGFFNVPSNTVDLALKLNGVTRLQIDKTSGFVRIGATTVPAYTLDVAGTINTTTLRVGGTLVGNWNAAATNINYTAGAVSIGTTATPAGYKLAVGGKMITEEIVVRPPSAWPDYVFDINYERMPLGELERYINQHKHLPDVPSAAEVAKDGVALGELNATLLKKIEELTLYMIELKKENDAQQKLIDELIQKKN